MALSATACLKHRAVDQRRTIVSDALEMANETGRTAVASENPSAAIVLRIEE